MITTTMIINHELNQIKTELRAKSKQKMRDVNGIGAEFHRICKYTETYNKFGRNMTGQFYFIVAPSMCFVLYMVIYGGIDVFIKCILILWLIYVRVCRRHRPRVPHGVDPEDRA